MKRLSINGFECNIVDTPQARRLAVLLYPMPIDDETLSSLASRHGVSIAAITVTHWDNMLSPWPAPGEPPGSPDFKGESAKFYKILTDNILPEINIPMPTDLIGVSMSGLFSMWQWALHSRFENIASLSGSFWYPGFVQWLEKQPINHQGAKAFLLLGDKEPHSPIAAFRSVGDATSRVVQYLQSQGINCHFERDPGNHFYDPAGRLAKAFNNLYPTS